MKERRKEELEIAKIARKRATNVMLLIILFEIIIILIVGATSGWYSIYQLIGMSVQIIIIIINICGFLLLRKNYWGEELNKRKNEGVEKRIPISTYVEVIPTKENDNQELIQRIRKIAKFYAIRNERNQMIEIHIKFDGEEKVYHYTNVLKRNFEGNYIIVEEKSKN